MGAASPQKSPGGRWTQLGFDRLGVPLQARKEARKSVNMAYAGSRVESELSCRRGRADGLQGQKGGCRNSEAPVHASWGVKGNGLLHGSSDKLADTAHRSLTHCKRPTSGPLLSQPLPSPPSASPLSPSYPCARSGDVAVLPVSSCPAVRAEPSASVSPTPQAELLGSAHRSRHRAQASDPQDIWKGRGSRGGSW